MDFVHQSDRGSTGIATLLNGRCRIIGFTGERRRRGEDVGFLLWLAMLELGGAVECGFYCLDGILAGR
jgi:hypothetical protein